MPVLMLRTDIHTQPSISNSHPYQITPGSAKAHLINAKKYIDSNPAQKEVIENNKLADSTITSADRRESGRLTDNNRHDDLSSFIEGYADVECATPMAFADLPFRNDAASDTPQSKANETLPEIIPTTGQPKPKTERFTWSELQEKLYPPLGGKVDGGLNEEKAAFVQSLDYVTRGLEGDEKTKAVLLHIMQRFKATGYRLFKDKEGSITEVWKGIPAIRYRSTPRAVDFWIRAAIESKHLPEGSQSYFLYDTPVRKLISIAQEICVYQSPDGDHYVMDITKGERLLTFKEHDALPDTYDKFEFRGQHKWYFNRNFDENSYLWYRPVTRSDRVALAYQSDTPLDKSISDADLKTKIYARYGLDPKTKRSLPPSAPETNDTKRPGKLTGTEEVAETDQSVRSYGDMLSQYADEDFYSSKFLPILEHPTELMTGVGAAVSEATVATAFAFYKRHKITHRRHVITAAHEIKNRQEVNSSYYQEKPMDLARFKDFVRLSFLIDPNGMDQESAPLLTLTKSHKSYQTTEDIAEILKALQTTFPEDSELTQFTSVIDDNYLADPKNIATLQKALTPYGISIKYQKIGTLGKQVADKFRKKKNEKLQACMHKTRLDKKVLYKKLQEQNKLPKPDIIATTVEKKQQVIATLNQLKNYDDWKLNYITTDTKIKVGAAATGIIPLFPVYDLVRFGAYYKEGRYRAQNKKNMEQRIINSLSVLEQAKGCFSEEHFQLLSTTLTNAQATKERHIDLKKNKVKVMKGIHLTSAGVAMFTDILGPIGSGSRSAAKGLAKVGSSVYPMVQRYKGDKKQKQQQTFVTTSDIYKLYKALYTHAKTTKDVQLNDAMTKLAEASFDLKPKEFDMLTNTSIVEDEQLKLSLCRPVGRRARVPENDLVS